MLAEDTPNTFWLEMYLAFSGFMLASLPYTIGSDVVTYYPLIGDISFKALQNMMGNYRKKRSAWTLYRNSNSMNRAKLDVLSSILFYKEMIAHLFDTYDEDTEIIEGLALDAIKGLVGYYYKDISTQIPFDETIFVAAQILSQDNEDPARPNGKWEMLDMQGQRLIEPVFDAIDLTRYGMSHDLFLIQNGVRKEFPYEFY